MELGDSVAIQIAIQIDDDEHQSVIDGQVRMSHK